MGKNEKRMVSGFRRQCTVTRIIVVAMTLSALCSGAWATVLLPVQRQEQENSSWCWAACCQTILNREGDWVEQCDMADWMFDRSDCCDSPTPEGCIGGGERDQIDNMLEHYGLNATYRARVLTANECWTEMDNGRPVYMSWDWDGGGGHAMVIVGISDDKVTIYRMDPWTGSTGGYWQASYSWTVDGCYGGGGACHTWASVTETDEDPTSFVRLRHTFDDNGWDYETIGTINSADFEVRDQGGQVTEFNASYIYLGTGFEVENGARFEANLI